MKQYYVHDGQNQKGPFSIEQLKDIKLNKETMVWCEGMETWKAAGELDELKSLFAAVPPPLPKNVNIPPPFTPKVPAAPVPQKKKRKGLVWIIVGASLGAILITALIIFLFFKSCNTNKGTSSTVDSVEVQTDTAVAGTASETSSGKNDGKSKNAITDSKKENNLTADQQKEEEQKAAYRTNWRKHVFARPNCSNGPFNIIVDPTVTLTNSLPYSVNEVGVYVNYILLDGSTWKTEKISFYNVGPNRTVTKDAPPTERGTTLQAHICKVTSSSLGLYYSN